MWLSLEGPVKIEDIKTACEILGLTIQVIIWDRNKVYSSFILATLCSL